MGIDVKAARNFANRWKNKRLSEDQFSQIFWIDLLNSIYDIDYSDENNVIFERVTADRGKIDVWLRGSSTMVEMKSTGVDLDKPESRQGEKKTPFKQVYDYAISFPRNEQPDYLITCNFEKFRVYNRKEYGDSVLEKNPIEFTLEELGKKPEYLGFLVDPNNSRLYKEKEISEEAGKLIGKLYDMLYEQYHDRDSIESQHALNVLCVRIVFCLFCEDANLFNEANAFSRYLADVPANNIREALKRLFKGLDTDINDRDEYDIRLQMFPYVNGGLFNKEYEIPNFTQEMKDFLIHEIAEPLDWSQISPTIFGGIFESTLNPETRHQGGMHYTTVQSIHKVIDPLFLDDLNAELDNINALTSITLKERNRRYGEFRRKISTLTFFDPACGSGNFLTETYLSLRKLEDRLNLSQYGDQVYVGMDNYDESTTVTLNQFYGIEINDFAVSVAETALWISRLKANNDSATLFNIDTADFPLTDKAKIQQGNALTDPWEDVLDPSECSYIIGNPPFVGARFKNDVQSNEIRNLMSPRHEKPGDLDYVTGWYRKAADYMLNTNIEAALVSTNSISQGEQVSLLWRPLLSEGITINYAHKTFPWDNEAAVHCIIIGFSYNSRTQKYLFEGDTASRVNNISPYLIDFGNTVVESHTTPICNNAPEMKYGSMPNDDRGKLSNISTETKNRIIAEYPESEQFFKRLLGSDEYINNIERWCLWLVDIPEDEYNAIPPIHDLVEAVRTARANSSRAATRRLALTPMLFGEIRQPQREYLLIPRTSSESRAYIPMGFQSPDVISSDANVTIEGASLYDFGVLVSSVHMAWMRTVAGRLEMRYRYSSEIVYNNFPWCTPNEEQKRAIEETAQTILDVRNNHSDMTLAEMYNIDTMPDDLREAHNANDRAVLDAYNFGYEITDLEIFSRLMRMYQRIITG